MGLVRPGFCRVIAPRHSLGSAHTRHRHRHQPQLLSGPVTLRVPRLPGGPAGGLPATAVGSWRNTAAVRAASRCALRRCRAHYYKISYLYLCPSITPLDLVRPTWRPARWEEAYFETLPLCACLALFPPPGHLADVKQAPRFACPRLHALAPRDE